MLTGQKVHSLPEVSDKDIGVVKEAFAQDRSDGLTTDDIEWALEKGAKSMEEVLNLVRDSKKDLGE